MIPSKTRVSFSNGSFLDCTVLADPVSRQRGLMGIRQTLVDQSVLFVFGERAKHKFWMKNTYIPLDIIFIDGDTVVEIVRGKPHDETYIGGNTLSDYAIEVTQGFVALNGIRVGMEVWL
jgi:hypothetical protein